jgi:hydrogen cyanide synthase HcnB
MSELQTVIVGAGPAGIRAAQALVAHGARPVLVDEAPRWGGQIYRQPPAGVGFRRSKKTIYGFEAARAHAVHSAMADILDRVDYRPDTLVWNAEGRQLNLISHGRLETLLYDNLIVATGANDRVLPFRGWTLPGVYALGAAQVALKYQGCSIGSCVVIAGTGPLLYLVAYQYAKAGVRVAAVLDTSSFYDKTVAVPAMLRQPTVFAKGVYYLGWLRGHGVPVHTGVRLLGAEANDVGSRVSAMRWKNGHQEHQVACDAVGFGYGLRSETQLADLLGCRFDYNPLQRQSLPLQDGAGRSSVAGIYLAGDGSGIMGADAAEWAGERAALALLADTGHCLDAASTARAAKLQTQLVKTAAFRQGLERAFPFPQDWAANASDDLIICRCEEITVGQLRMCVHETGVRDINRLKALTRLGMGRCQGRTCGVAAAEILAHACNTGPCEVGRLRGQAPIKPLAFSAVSSKLEDESQ